MHDAKKPDAGASSAEPSKPSEPDPVKKGGFGAFADVYRARWVANHPHMRRTDASSQPAPTADGSVTRPFAEDGTRLIRPEDAK